MEKLIQILKQINWNFSDYSSKRYPLDINSIHWYPASFPPLIPKYLISLLTQEGDLILDPFGGSGTTSVEALKLGRPFVYNDLNPFAVDIIDAKKCAISRILGNALFLIDEVEVLDKYHLNDSDLLGFIEIQKINPDVTKWFDRSTLLELCQIYLMMRNEEHIDLEKYIIRKCAFSSILKTACSQTEHYTYVTDNCWPKVLKRKEATKLYLSQIEKIRLSIEDFIRQYSTLFNHSDLRDVVALSTIHSGDARSMDWLGDNSVDFVLTSPPYLCANDYIKTMRLTNLFFPNEIINEKVQAEIGSRRKRKNDTTKTVNEFYDDMDKVFSQISRVLKEEKFFCLIMGQGEGRITVAYDTVAELENKLENKYGFKKVFKTERLLSHRRVRVGGVRTESIIVFKKLKKVEG